jgi:translation initiation factor 2 gamma subunit (eIF-2gamma)
MKYNEFFFWISGFMSKKNIKDITQEDLDLINEKIRQTENEDTIENFVNQLLPNRNPIEPIRIKNNEDD